MNTYIILFLLLVSLTGAIYDFKSRRIPNWLTFGTFFIILVFNILSLDLNNIFKCILGFTFGLLLLLLPYILGGMGAGDVKLLAAIGSIVGYKNIILIFIYSGLSGLLLVLLWIIVSPERIKFLITTGQLLPAVDKKQKIPYGIAIFLGTALFVLFSSGNFFNILIW